jgi:hypothetical protein
MERILKVMMPVMLLAMLNPAISVSQVKKCNRDE